MRLEELQLERFGHFSGHSLDFSGKDILVHLIYGPNETGKSTALTAICDLLFGIPERTPYSFLHEYGRLRIGGTLTNSAGQRLSFKRRKARANTLLRLDESAELSKTALVPFLGSISRELFERMFGLNYQRLRNGGQNMVRSGGELAKNLFEAGSGTLGVASVAAALSAEADSIGSPSRRSGSKPYWRSYDRYEEAMDRVRAESLKAEAWNAAVKALDDGIERRKELDTALAERRQERSRVERVRRVVPLLRRLEDLRAEQESLLGSPLFSDGFENRWRELVQALAAARESVRANTETVNRLQQEKDTLGDPGLWPTFAKRIQTLITGLGDYRKQRNDLPHRLRDLENGSRQMADLLRQLCLAIDPATVEEQMPSELTVARVRSLIGEWNRLDTALQKAQEELDSAEKELQQNQLRVTEVRQPADPATAKVAFDAARAMGDVPARAAKTKLELQVAETELRDALASLGRCSLEAEALDRAILPSEDLIVNFEREFDRNSTDEQTAADQLETLNAELRRINTELETLHAAGEMPTPEALGFVRRRRDQTWRLIRRKYVEGLPVTPEQITEVAADGDMPSNLETGIAAADRLADRREREAARIERFATLTRQHGKVLEDIAACEGRIQKLRNAKAVIESKWGSLWKGTGISAGTPLEMRSWLTRKDHVLVRHQNVRKASLALEAVEIEVETLQTHLLRAAGELGIADAEGMPRQNLKDRVTTSIETATTRWHEFRGNQAAVLTSSTARNVRASDLDNVTRRLEVWRTKWAEQMPLIGLEPVAEPVEADSALAVWHKIGELEADLAQTRRRRDQITDAIAEYESEVRAVLGDLSSSAIDIDEESDISGLVPVLQQRLSDSLQLSARVQEATRNLNIAKSDLKKAEDAANAADAEVRSVRNVYRLSADADVLQLAEASARRRFLDAQIAEQRAALAHQGDGYDEAFLREEVAGFDVDAAAHKVASLEDEIADLQVQAQAAAQAVTTAETTLRTLRAREGVGEAAQEAHDAAAEMLGHVERWLRLKTASIVLSRAVERYRTANQHPLVRRASEIFAAVAGTGSNPIIRLSVDYADEDDPVLVGFRRDGSICPVSGMSDGTADQLYLSLRIAGVELYMDSAEPMPFVADDLFVTSDEERTVAGIRTLSELGRRTQVLLFTHHRYVVDAAAGALQPSDLKVHMLPLLPSGEHLPAAA